MTVKHNAELAQRLNAWADWFDHACPKNPDSDLRLAAQRCVEVDRLRASNTELQGALKDVLRMLEAAYRDLGMSTKDNKRVTAARAVLEAAARDGGAS
jgi:hypothetical protein